MTASSQLNLLFSVTQKVFFKVHLFETFVCQALLALFLFFQCNCPKKKRFNSNDNNNKKGNKDGKDFSLESHRSAKISCSLRLHTHRA